MNRRRFLKVCGLAGLAVMAPISLREGRASSTKYTGPFFVTVNAGGGWDPTLLCDPKGGVFDDHKSVNQSYTPDQKGMAGNIPHAPTEMVVDGILVESAPNFFQKHGGRLTVLNGIDTSTNNHDSGSRATWCGQLAEGYPSFAAIAAAQVTLSNPVPMAYLSNGGYDATAGVVSLTRVGDTEAVGRLAYPNIMNPSDPDSRRFHTQATASRIAAAQASRLQAMQQKQRLPTARNAMSALFLARTGDEGLQLLGQEIAQTPTVSIDDIPDLAPINDRGRVGDLQNLMRQAQVAVLAFKSGVAVSANLDIGGFDTHGNHDSNHIEQIMQLMRGIDYLYGQLDAAGIASQTYVIVGSDFGRTPYYNDDNGKDHWNITSMLVSGPNIAGNRTVGGTDDGYKPLTINAKNAQLDPGGIRLEPKHIHRALRKAAGLTNTKFDIDFPLAGEDIPLFV
jgi:hypothetical protein